MAPPISDEITRLVHSLFAERSLWDRVRVRRQDERDERVATLAQIAATGEVRVAPDLLPLLAADEALVPHVARAIAALVREVTPAQLSWLDERVRRGSYLYDVRSAWQTLAPGAVAGLARAADFEPSVVGLLTSHAKGFVRAAALEVLAQQVDGREIPFLSLRVNDWVDAIAVRARELLMRRLQPDNRHAVLAALPFIVRVFRQRRRDHGEIARALTGVLLSDGGDAALAQAAGYATPVRRVLYELLVSGSETAGRARIIEAALGDADGVIRLRAIRVVVAQADAGYRAAVLERLLRADPVPAVRRLALAMLAEHAPDRIADLLPDVLLDRAASVRALARFVAGTRQLPIVPRDFYIQGLVSISPQLPSRRISAAIAGVGETGTGADAEVITPFLASARPRQRRAALRALVRLDAERAVASAIAALSDDTRSVRAAAIDILASQAHAVDFDDVQRRVRSHPDRRVRRDVLRLFIHAPKWQAAALLLEALVDADAEARVIAAGLVDRWVEQLNRSQTQPAAQQLERIRARLDAAEPLLSKQTMRMLRFVSGARPT